MKKINTYLWLLCSTLLFVACEKEIDFTGKVTNSEIVISSFITPDSVIKAQVSESRFFLNDDYTFKPIDNAIITVYINGSLRETMQHLSNGIYIASIKPKVGDIVKLIAKVSSMKDVSCETDIVQPSELIQLDTISTWTGSKPILDTVTTTNNNETSTQIVVKGKYRFRTINITLTLKDNIATNNYYRLVVDKTTVSGTKVNVNYEYSLDDIISGNTKEVVPGPPSTLGKNVYHVFTDDMINGKQYPLIFSIKDTITVMDPGYARPLPKKTIHVNLQNTSKSFYLYLKTLDAKASANELFSEPIQIYTNVVGGIGILGSYTSNVWTIEL